MEAMTEGSGDWAASIRDELDPGTVEPAVRDLLGRPGATVAAFVARPVEYPNVSPAARQLVKVTGTARDGDEILPWSLVLKAFRHPEDPDHLVDDPSHYEYWRREPLFFESGLSADLAPGLSAVPCHGVHWRTDDEVWIWLEELTDDHPEGWPPERFVLAAHHLGEFGGAYAAGRALPSAPWLASTRSIQVQYSIVNPAVRAPVLEALESPHRRARKAFGAQHGRQALRDAFLRQAAFLDTLDAAPRTLCHNDTMAANLFARQGAGGASETVAIDWALVGIGPLGGDLAQLVAGSACFFRAPVDDLDRLDRQTFEAYLEGVKEGGARVASSEVRLACLVTILCQWSAVVAFHLIQAVDPAEEAWVTEFWHRPPREVVAQFTPLLAFLGRRARETLELVDS
jgi:hypothetical protein